MIRIALAFCDKISVIFCPSGDKGTVIFPSSASRPSPPYCIFFIYIFGFFPTRLYQAFTGPRRTSPAFRDWSLSLCGSPNNCSKFACFKFAIILEEVPYIYLFSCFLHQVLNSGILIFWSPTNKQGFLIFCRSES